MSFSRVSSLPAILTLAAASLANGQPGITTVVNGASFEPGVAPGSLVAIYGKGLASASASNPGLPLPTSLAGTSVQVNGVAAELYFVSDTQVNAIVPLETPSGGTVPVVVTAGGTPSQPYRMKVDACAPAIFTRVGNGTGTAIVFSSAYKLLEQVAPGDVISFYATGLGAVAPSQDGYTRTSITPTLSIGESAAIVAYAGPSGYPGVYQVNAVVPPALASERFFLSCAPPYLSNIADIGIPAGRNTVDASGQMQALYPKTGSSLTISQVAMAARFTARFTAAAGAAPFPVAAVSDAGSIVFTVDPASGRITGRSQLPTQAERHGDFSLVGRASGFLVLDFLAGGTPVPGNVVAAVRLDPAAVSAFAAVPLPNSAPAEPNFLWEGNLSASGAMTLDDATTVNTFGHFLPIPYAPWLTNRSATFRLYIDGKLVASDKVTYVLAVPPPPVVVALKEVTLASSSVMGGSPVQGTVTLTAPAATGGALVTLQSDNAAASVPASVTVPAGQSSAAFPIATKVVANNVNALLTARYGADSKTATLQVKASGNVGAYGILFIPIPAGEFMMGCSPGDTLCLPSESPRHRVKITKSFEMGKFEVTQAQWQAVMGTKPSWVRDPADPDNPNRPVQQVSPNDVQTFLAALNARSDGYRYRLPTEAEWEYTARAGTTDIYAGGILSEVACTDWYNTCPVGSFKPNAWGLYDMLGNVKEVCSDWMNDQYYASSPTEDPQGPATPLPQFPNRSVRGGAWGVVGERQRRVSARDTETLDNRNLTYGVRIARQK